MYGIRNVLPDDIYFVDQTDIINIGNTSLF